MKLQEYLKQYSEAGFKLFPLNAKSKRPLFEDMLNVATDDYKTLIEWAKEFPGCGWAVSLHRSGLVCVDIDHAHGGMDKWTDYILENGEPETLMQESGSGGLHYIFKENTQLKYKGKLTPGIDVKWNGYILLEPSLHKKGAYKFPDGFKPEKISDVPDWLEVLISRVKKEGKKANSGDSFSMEYMDTLAEEAQEHDFDYEEWLKMGMAFHSVDSTSAGLDLWKKASQNASFNEGDLEQCESKWESFEADEQDGVGQMSLVYMLRSKGVDIPNASLEQDKKIFEIVEEKKHEKQQTATQSEFIEESGRWVSWSREYVMEFMKNEGYSFFTEGGNASVVCSRRGNRGGIEAKTMTMKALRERVAPYFLKHFGKSSTGKKVVKYTNIADYWLQSIHRPEIDRIVFNPNPGPRELSTWSEPIVVPRPVSQLTKDFCQDVIFKSICNSNRTHYNEVMGQLAHIVQEPQSKSSKILTIFGDQGTGKGLLFIEVMGRILGSLQLTLNNPRMFTDRFNVPLSNRLLIVGDEIVSGDSRAFNSAIKNFSGNNVLHIEEKFGATYQIENYARLIILSNSENAVMIERSNRRFYPIHTSNEYAGSVSFFDKYWVAARSEDLACEFFQLLLDWDLSSWHPHILPGDNLDGESAKLETAGIQAQFWNHIFSEEPKQLFRSRKADEEKEWLDRNAAYSEFNDFLDLTKYKGPGITVEKFWRESKKYMKSLNGHGIKKQIGEWGRQYFMYSSPEELKEEFYSSIKMPEPEGFEPWDYYQENDFTTEQ